MIEYNHTIEQAAEYSQKAMMRVKKEGLPPTPENYELWYVYYSGQSPEVTKAINVIVSNKQDFTDKRCIELHGRFIKDNRHEDLMQKASEKVNSTLRTMSGVVNDVKTATTEYNGKLGNFSGEVADVEDPNELKRMLSAVMEETADMMNKNAELESKLDQSSEEMIELQKNLDTIKKEAMADGLTGLSNRKAFDMKIQHIADECRASEEVFSLLMMDIDHFKSFNDNYGHQVGDQVLRLVARTLTDGIKGRDSACRYGGEEFSIILPDTPLKAAEKVAEHLRAAVARKEVVNRGTGEKLGKITISIGVAQFSAQEEGVDDLIERADAALYTAKNTGRNRVCAAPTVVKVKSKKSAG